MLGINQLNIRPCIEFVQMLLHNVAVDRAQDPLSVLEPLIPRVVAT